MKASGWLSLLLSGLKVPVMANKDSSYYPGYTNPNVKVKMYWKDAADVLDDIDQFESLYIKYHRCVWSPYQDADGDSSCGVEENDEENSWYLGQSGCYRANVAFSLYGRLKGDMGLGGFFGPCNKKNFINSFFTTYGVETIATPFGIDTTYANSYCKIVGCDCDNDDGDCDCEVNQGDNDDYQDLSNNEMFYDGYRSMGMGCSRHGKFLLDLYNGAYCGASHFLKTTNSLSNFNSDIEELKCVQIHSADGDGSYQYEEDAEYDEYDEYEDEEQEADNGYGDNENENEEEEEEGADDDVGDEEEDEGQEDDEDEQDEAKEEDGDNGNRGRKLSGNGDYSDQLAYRILSYSRACSIREHPNDCPDPYGLVARYTKSLEKAAHWHWNKRGMLVRTILSWSLFIAGLAMFAYAYFLKRTSNPKRKRYAKRIDDSESSEDDSTTIFDDISRSFSGLSGRVGAHAKALVNSWSSCDSETDSETDDETSIGSDAAGRQRRKSRSTSDESDAEVADAMLAERGYATSKERARKERAGNSSRDPRRKSKSASKTRAYSGKQLQAQISRSRLAKTLFGPKKKPTIGGF